VSRLPAALQPAWPLFKRAHRMLALVLGTLWRLISPALGERGVPRRATDSSVDTVRREPATTRLHPAGAAEFLERAMPPGLPADHWCFAEKLEVSVPARATLEVEQGTVIGDYAAVVTSEGTLDYQSSGYFGLSSWREHPVFLTPRHRRPEQVDGSLLVLATRGTDRNYYHFLFDALPRFGIFTESLPGQQVDAIYVPHATRYQRELLGLLGLDQHRLIQPAPDAAYRAKTLLVPSTPNQDLAAPRWGTEWLRQHLPPTTTDGPRRLYLTRGSQPNTRRYVQEPELVPELVRRGFTVVDPGTFSVQEQINLFAGAEIVVAPHGAGLTNIAFSAPGTAVLELFANDYVHLGLWAIAESVGGIHYRYLVAEGGHRPGKPMVGVLQDVDIPAARVLAAVDELLA
jgi:capsular polysaccharide biosynthesis protein